MEGHETSDEKGTNSHSKFIKIKKFDARTMVFHCTTQIVFRIFITKLEKCFCCKKQSDENFVIRIQHRLRLLGAEKPSMENSLWYYQAMREIMSNIKKLLEVMENHEISDEKDTNIYSKFIKINDLVIRRALVFHCITQKVFRIFTTKLARCFCCKKTSAENLAIRIQ